MDKAILIPTNPHREFRGGQDEGNIKAHEAKIKEVGANYYRLVMPGDRVVADFPHREIRRGYFYDVTKKEVTHACEIEWIRPMPDLEYSDSQRYFLETFRNEEHFREVSEIFYVLKLTAIFKLSAPFRLSDFRKYNNDEPVKLVRNYCIVHDPEKTDPRVS